MIWIEHNIEYLLHNYKPMHTLGFYQDYTHTTYLVEC